MAAPCGQHFFRTKRTLSHVIIDDPSRNNKPRRHGIFSHSFNALLFLDFGLAMQQYFKLLLQILAALPFGTRERLRHTIGYRLSEPALFHAQTLQFLHDQAPVADPKECPWVMPGFSPAWTLTRLSLQDKKIRAICEAAVQHRFNTHLSVPIGY
jgi:hypothetical protein